jgi:hypothetical protein
MKNTASYKMIKLIIVSGCVFFIPSLSFAQQTRGKVTVVKDPLIDTLIARRPYLSKTAGDDNTASGYRVQIFFGSDRQAAYNAQAKFQNEYPEIKTYISYTEPNFKVRVGDFRSRLEAQKLQSELTGMFSTLFIVPEKISTKPDGSND